MTEQAPRRLLIVVPTYASYHSFLKGCASWFAGLGWEIHVATNLAGARAEKDVVRLHNVEMPRGANILQLLKAGHALTGIIRAVQPTVVHAHFSVGMLCLALSKRIKDVRYLGTFQGMRFPLASGIRRWIFKCVECFSILRLDQSWVLTQDDYSAVPRSLRGKVAIQEGYGFGCDIEHFDPKRFPPRDDLSLRAELGIPREHTVFIFVGRLTAFKGFDLALSAFRKLRSEHVNVSFLVVGEPDSLHPLALPGLNSIEGVHYVGWQDDPAPYLVISDAMVFPSEREGVPVCIMEALSMGVPVIGCDRRGVRELVQDGVTGIIVTRDAVSIQDAMNKMMTDPECFNGLTRGALHLRESYDRSNFYRMSLRSYLAHSS